MLDHLVYAALDLSGAIEDLERRLAVRPALGGQHAGGLTHNALLSLGEGSYLEIIARVPEAPADALPFGLGALTEPRLVTWAVAVNDIDSRVVDARARGYNPGDVIPGGRDLPGGGRLEWRLALTPRPSGDGVVPFLIQWTSQPHPSLTSPQGCRLVGLRAEHPQPDDARAKLTALAVDLQVVAGAAPRLIATIDTPRGTVDLS
ncbi:MAG TPA: VOC family protein [Dehalococcoidia bacterium]|nr:VOC family protein [Dehalococcoidia bacterium]